MATQQNSQNGTQTKKRAPRKKPTQQMFVEDEVDQDLESEEPVEEKETVKESDHSTNLPSGANFIDLPSNGRLGYPAQVTYRDVLVKDESALATVTEATLNRTLNSTLKSILNDWEYFEQMSIHDRDYALMWIWANNYSPVKTAEITCPDGRTEKVEVDLTDVEVTDVDPNIPFPMKIPYADGEISVYPTTVGNEIEVESYIGRLNEADKKEANYEQLLMISTIDLGANISLEQKVKWVRENLSGKVFGYVRKYHNYFKFGVKETIEHKCAGCEEVTEFALPFQITDILFPEPPDDFERLLQSQ